MSKLRYFEFAGKIVGKCLFDSAKGSGYRQLVKAKFSRSFLAQLIGLQVNYKVELYNCRNLVNLSMFICELINTNTIDLLSVFWNGWPWTLQNKGQIHLREWHWGNGLDLFRGRILTWRSSHKGMSSNK